MRRPAGSRARGDVAADAVSAAIDQMTFWSRAGEYIAPRYRVALLGYGEDIEDAFGGVRTIDQVSSAQLRSLRQQTASNVSAAFERAEQIVRDQLADLSSAPAPLICHVTDGAFSGADLTPAVQRLMDLTTHDGAVLVEHLLVSDHILPASARDPKQWPGITPRTELTSATAAKLRRLTSPMPESYREGLLAEGYRIDAGAFMLLPAANPELVRLALTRPTSREA